MTLSIPWLPDRVRLERHGSEPLPAHASLSAGGDWIVPVELLSDREIDEMAEGWAREMKRHRDRLVAKRRLHER